MWLLALMIVQSAPAAGEELRCDADLRQTEEQREYSGIYVDDFEGQRFFEGAKHVSELDFREPSVWIQFDRDAAVDKFGVGPMLRERAYLVRFRGTRGRERAPGQLSCGYGHMNSSVQAVDVVELLSIIPLEPVR